MATHEEFSAALERVQEAVDNIRKWSAMLTGPLQLYGDVGSELRVARQTLGCLDQEIYLLLSPSLAMTREQAQAEAEEITKVWHVAICECRHCVKDRTLLERVASALQSAADAAALQARLEMAGRVAELERQLREVRAELFNYQQMMRSCD